MHHIVNESHQRAQCVYCGNSLKMSKWLSEHWSEHHYKTTVCSCGRKIRVKVDFHGSGHDSWDNTIEEKIK